MKETKNNRSIETAPLWMFGTLLMESAEIEARRRKNRAGKLAILMMVVLLMMVGGAVVAHAEPSDQGGMCLLACTTSATTTRDIRFVTLAWRDYERLIEMANSTRACAGGLVACADRLKRCEQRQHGVMSASTSWWSIPIVGAIAALGIVTVRRRSA